MEPGDSPGDTGGMSSMTILCIIAVAFAITIIISLFIPPYR